MNRLVFLETCMKILKKLWTFANIFKLLCPHLCKVNIQLVKQISTQIYNKYILQLCFDAFLCNHWIHFKFLLNFCKKMHQNAVFVMDVIIFVKKKSFGIFKWIAHSCLYLFIIKFTSVFTVTDLNTSYLTDLHIVFTLKMESVYKNTIVGLKMKVKSGLEKIFLKFLYAEDYFHLLKCPKSQIH